LFLAAKKLWVGALLLMFEARPWLFRSYELGEVKEQVKEQVIQKLLTKLTGNTRDCIPNQFFN